jgi:homoserine dehydrogenase
LHRRCKCRCGRRADPALCASLFREALPAARLMRFRGILNSTTNLILTEMEHGTNSSASRLR